MKVFVVTDGEYSDYRILEVFSSMEKAEKYCATRECELDCPEILEFEIDAICIESKNMALRKWSVHFKGGRVVCFENGFTFSAEKKVHAANSDGRQEYRVTVTTDTKAGEDVAMKAAQDFLAKWKYEQVEKELS